MPVSFIGGPHFKTPSLGNSFYNRQPVNTLVAPGGAGDHRRSCSAVSSSGS